MAALLTWEYASVLRSLDTHIQWAHMEKNLEATSNWEPTCGLWMPQAYTDMVKLS